MKIIAYKTATGSDIPELDKAVNALIGQGYEPHGGPYFGTWNIPNVADTVGFFQAMVKCEKPVAKIGAMVG